MLIRVDHKRTYNVGMEVFTIGGHGSSCRTVEDPPYPIIMLQERLLQGVCVLAHREGTPTDPRYKASYASI